LNQQKEYQKAIYCNQLNKKAIGKYSLSAFCLRLPIIFTFAYSWNKKAWLHHFRNQAFLSFLSIPTTLTSPTGDSA
jgi:hypothetical protein